MAPEVITGNKYNEKVDVYSYGIIMWEILHDKPPFKGIINRIKRSWGIYISSLIWFKA